MDNSYLITVAIPAYNHEKYIHETLESVKNSTWHNIELLIIDDGSKDNTFGAASNWIDQNRSRFQIASIKRQENQGVCRTLNRLTKEAQGKYVAIIASDDRLLPNSLYLRSSVLESNSWADAVFSDSELINENGAKVSGTLHLNGKTCKCCLLNRELQFFEILLNWKGCGPGLMIRKRQTTSKDMDFDESILIEDLEFFLRKSYGKTLAYIPEPLQEYRIISDSFSHDQRRRPQIRLAEIQSLESIYGRTKSFRRIVTLLSIWRFKTIDSQLLITKLVSRYLLGALCKFMHGLIKFYALNLPLFKSK